MFQIVFSKASVENYPEILELNKSLVPSWFKYNKDALGDSTSWSVLSTRERFLHGGPWLSTDTLEIHFHHFKKYGDVILMWEKDVLIGEVEFHQIKDPKSVGAMEQKPTFHIDWIMIKAEYQGKGYGTKILQYLDAEIMNRVGGDFYIITEPELGITNFYTNNGFTTNLPKISVYTSSGKLSGSNWEQSPAELYQYTYGNYDVSNEYTQFLLETEMDYAKLFKTDPPISYLDIDENTRVVRAKASAFSSRYKIIISSRVSLSQNELVDCLDVLTAQTPSSDTLSISLPFEFESEKWEFKYSVPKLLKSM